jgi:hypothetical protein
MKLFYSFIFNEIQPLPRGIILAKNSVTPLFRFSLGKELYTPICGSDPDVILG